MHGGRCRVHPMFPVVGNIPIAPAPLLGCGIAEKTPELAQKFFDGCRCASLPYALRPPFPQGLLETDACLRAPVHGYGWARTGKSGHAWARAGPGLGAQFFEILRRRRGVARRSTLLNERDVVWNLYLDVSARGPLVRTSRGVKRNTLQQTGRDQFGHAGRQPARRLMITRVPYLKRSHA